MIVWMVINNSKTPLQEESEGFSKLKADLQALQGEFNKVDDGWKYSEGCVGKGGVFDRDKATSCSLGITSQAKDDITINDYLKIAMNSKKFTLKNSGNEIATFYSLSSSSYRASKCALEAVKTNIGKTYLSLGCFNTASKFYFPRTDR